MSSDMKKTEARFHLMGWLIFIVCAIFFIIESLSAGNILFLVASLVFLGGCIVFLIPLVAGWNRRGE